MALGMLKVWLVLVTVECQDWVTLLDMVVIPSQWLSMKGMMSMSLENMVLLFDAGLHQVGDGCDAHVRES